MPTQTCDPQKLFPFENGRNSLSLRDDIPTGIILP
jgi:hypothetical protein